MTYNVFSGTLSLTQQPRKLYCQNVVRFFLKNFCCKIVRFRCYAVNTSVLRTDNWNTKLSVWLHVIIRLLQNLDFYQDTILMLENKKKLVLWSTVRHTTYSVVVCAVQAFSARLYTLENVKKMIIANAPLVNIFIKTAL